MSGRFKFALGFILLLCLSTIPLRAQLLEDTTALSLVKKDIDYIYNLQFKEAQELYTKIVGLYPDHPIAYLLKGMMAYWQNYPMLRNSPQHVSFEADLRECIRLSEKNPHSGHEAEYLLADLSARGLLLMYYDDNDLIMEVTPLTISSYKFIRRAFDYTTGCYDLYYFTGVYNYYREAYPRIYPVYKSLAFLFPHGDIETGLRQLQTAAINSVVLRAESAYLLIWIYLSYENRMPESLYYCKTLHDKYPQNGVYFELYLRNLLLMKKYDQAEKLIATDPIDENNNFFKGQLTILKGILQEKKYHNNKLAQENYTTGINEISIYSKYGNEFAAYGYFGLSRISDENGEKSHKTYRKEALKLADIKKINFDK